MRRFGGEAVIIEGADRLLAREPAPAEALGEALRRDGIELMLGMHASAARREGDELVLRFDGGTDLRGDRLLVATGRRPRVEGRHPAPDGGREGARSTGVRARPVGAGASRARSQLVGTGCQA